MLLVIIFVVLAILILIMIIRLKSNLKFVVARFKENNVGIYGNKRTGKDLVFQKVINKRNSYYYSNINYGGKLIKEIVIGDMKLGDNTYHDFINDNIEKIDRELYEQCDIYISDGGNYLPSQYYKDLEKKYKGFGLFMSLQGHTYDSNTHFNWNGKFTRLYDKAREQLAEVFQAKRTIFIPFIGGFVKLRYYERTESAEINLNPYRNNNLLDSRENKALRNQYYATNGYIKDLWIFVSKWSIKYDTRAFEKKVFKKDSQRLIKGLKKRYLK